MSRTYCSVDGCMNQKKNKTLTFFSLPLQLDKRKEWLQLIGRPDLDKPNIKPRSYMVCSQHFDVSSIITVKKLQPDVVPTKLLPLQSQPNTSSSEINIKKTEDKCVQTKDFDVTDLSIVNIKTETTADTNTEQIKTENSYLEKSTQTSKSLSSDTPRKRKLNTALKDSEKKRAKLEIELDMIKKELEAKNTLSLSDCDDEGTERFHKLIQWQNNIKNKYKGNRYSSDYKVFALNLHFSSPQTYQSLKQILKLPSESTLERMKLNISTKFDDSILDCIKCKLKSLPAKAKYCTICVDEMVLKRHLYYDGKSDQIIGLHDINGKVTKEVASNAYVIMLRGIAIKWEQPIAYAFLSSTKHEEIDTWMNEIIVKLSNLGLKILAIVSNQNSNFDRYAKEIKQVTAEKPYFVINNNKIYYIFDVPHLIKCLRNNLLTNDFYWEGKKVSWSYIKLLYSHQKEQNLRLMPNVTDAHINPNKLKKIRVKYAFQIFSRSVYAALNTFIYAKLLPEEARPTANFVLLMNDLFDILNSSRVRANYKYKAAFTGNKDQIEILQNAKNAFETMTAMDPSTGANNTNQIKTFENAFITIQSILLLHEDLKKEDIKSIFTRRFNQDPLESFFEAIRQQGGNGHDPTPVQFMKAFSKLFLSNMLKNTPSSNCEADLFDSLLNQTQLQPSSFRGLIQPSIQSQVTLRGENDYRFDVPTVNAVTYVAGYLLFKCSNKHHCAEFDASFKEEPDLKENMIGISTNKEFNKKMPYGNLKMPPASFLDYINRLEASFIRNFEEIVISNPGNSLLSILQNEKFEPPCPCFPLQYLLKLFVRFRIFATIKFNNMCFREGKNFIRDYIKVKQL